MGIFLVKQPSAAGRHTADSLVVAAEDAAKAKTFAASHFSGDASWASAVATEMTEATMDASASQLGYTWRITITGGAAQTIDPIVVSSTGTGTDDLDAVAALLVIALNAEDDIANAAYSAPNLTCSSIADDIGDATVVVQVFRPTGDTNANLESIFVDSITHEGIAGAALVVAMVADTEIQPEVLDELIRI